MVSQSKMREILFQGKTNDGEWLEGFYAIFSSTPFIGAPNHYGTMLWSAVKSKTVGQFTGVYDTELVKIFEGDIVRFLRYVGTVVFENGCFGIAISEKIDWDYIAEEMEEYAGLGYLTACHNDNFISLWEILWNFNCEESVCNVVEIIGNIHDNPELLEVSHA